MAIQPFDTHRDAIEAIGQFLVEQGQHLPPRTASSLTSFYPSNIPRYVATAEALYACRDEFEGELATAALTLCAQLAAFAVDNSFDVLGQTDRGPKMIKACRRRLGESVNQAVSNDPEILPDYDLTPPPQIVVPTEAPPIVMEQ